MIDAFTIAAAEQAHERLHIHDTRAQAIVENWDQTRRRLPGGRAVMITDASNQERDQMNAMAQERRTQAGESIRASSPRSASATPCTYTRPKVSPTRPRASSRGLANRQGARLRRGQPCARATQIYVSREDLDEHGMDTGAIERLAERMKRSRAQEATIAKNVVEHDDDTILHDRSEQPRQEQAQADTPKPLGQPQREHAQTPIDIRQASPSDIHLHTVDLGNIRLTYSQQLYDLQSHTGEPTYILLGGWQTEQELGYIAVTRDPEHTNVHISTEERGDRDIETELTNRIEQVIDRSQQATAERQTIEGAIEQDRDHNLGFGIE